MAWNSFVQWNDYTAGEQGGYLQHVLLSNQMSQQIASARATHSELQGIHNAAKQHNELLRAVDNSVQDVGSSVQDVGKAVDRQGIAMTEAMQFGFALVSDNLGTVREATEHVSSAIEELSATFSQSFAQVLTEIGHCSDDLKGLLQAAKTPVQVAAYNHYAIARDAFRQGLYAECLEELDRAISGDNASSGYKLDWRFHFLKGTVRLGFVGCDPNLISLDEAEQAFLLAARYARANYPKDAARAFLQAGWAAYCNDKLPVALETTRLAYHTNNNLDYAYFQAAKISAGLHLSDDVRGELLQAAVRNMCYLYKANCDNAFAEARTTIHDVLHDCVKQHIEEVYTTYSRMKQQLLELTRTGGDCQQALLHAYQTLPSEQDLTDTLWRYTEKLIPEHCEKKRSIGDLFCNDRIMGVLSALNAEVGNAFDAVHATVASLHCLQQIKETCDNVFAEARSRYAAEVTPRVSRQQKLREQIAYNESLLLQFKARSAKAEADIPVLEKKIADLITLLESRLARAWNVRQHSLYWRIRRRFRMGKRYRPQWGFTLRDHIGLTFGLNCDQVRLDTCDISVVNEHFLGAVRAACLPETAYCAVWSDFIETVRVLQKTYRELEEALTDIYNLSGVVPELNAILAKSEKESTTLQNALTAEVTPLKKEYEQLKSVWGHNAKTQETAVSRVAGLCEDVAQLSRQLLG